MTTDKPTLAIAVVDALAQWTSVEISLAGLFRTISDIERAGDKTRTPKAYTVFEAIISFDGRLAVIDALMAEETLTPLEQETWNKFSARLRKLYKRRHALAHFTFSQTGGLHAKDPSLWDHEIAPFITIGAMMRGDVQTLGLAQINERAEHFAEATVGLGYFMWQAEGRRGQPQDSPTPEPPLVARLRELASQTLEERARKPKPSDPLSETD